MVSPQTLNSFCFNGLNMYKIVLQFIFSHIKLKKHFWCQEKIPSLFWFTQV